MTPARILVVDDEEAVLTNLTAFLEDEGYEVLQAADALVGLAQLADSAPVDLAVVDIRLPGMDGNAFISEAQRLYPDLKFLVHTGSPNYTLPHTLAAVGIAPDDVLLKPLSDMRVLANAVRRLLGPR